MTTYSWLKMKIVAPLMVTAVLLPAGVSAQDKNSIKSPPIPADQFGTLNTLIKPQAGELRFHEIRWLLDVWEARRKAAAEGKPILVWAGSGGAPIGGC